MRNIYDGLGEEQVRSLAQGLNATEEDLKYRKKVRECLASEMSLQRR